jgi:hypothetical protein
MWRFGDIKRRSDALALAAKDFGFAGYGERPWN